MHVSEETKFRKRAINLTIREDVLSEAKSLNLNASRAAEDGILKAIKAAREARWLSENASSIDALNQRVDHEGTLLAPHWEE